MAYACGDCYPQYRVDTIYLDSKGMLKKGDEVNLTYFKNGRGLELVEEIDSCWICYEFYIEGKMRNNLFTNKTVKVDKYHLKLRRECCE
jgi:hypothetical protein